MLVPGCVISSVGGKYRNLIGGNVYKITERKELRSKEVAGKHLQCTAVSLCASWRLRLYAYMQLQG